MSLAAFHTAFIALGVALFLPFTGIFATRIERLLPERGPRLTRHLDDTLLAAPSVALEATQRFFARIPPVAEDQALPGHRVALLHAIDHLAQLAARVSPPPDTRQALARPVLRGAIDQGRAALALAQRVLQGQAPEDWRAAMEGQARTLAELREMERLAILRQTAGGGSGPLEAMAALDALRWLERVSHHAWRACLYLAQAGEPGPNGVVETPAPLDE